VYIVSDDIPDTEYYPWGNQLITKIMTNPKKCNVYLYNSGSNPYRHDNSKPSGSYTQATNEEFAFRDNTTGKNRVGSDVDIILNPQPVTHYVAESYDSNIAEDKKEEDVFIVLAHELIHADRYMNGVAFDSKNKVNGQYTYRMRGLFGRVVTRPAPAYHNIEEYIVVGLINEGENNITENKIRKEHIIPKRLVYSLE